MSNYSESHFLRLQDYIADGSKGELSPAEQEYENLLFSTVGIARKEGRESARDWLMEDRGCSRHVAERIVNEAINLFYATDGVRKEAWRNLLFQKLLTAATDWEMAHVTIDDEGKRVCKACAKDYDAYVKIIKQAAKLKLLGEPDDDKPKLGNVIQNNIYYTNAQKVGMPVTDKRAIMQNPYFQQLAKKDQRRLEMEIGAIPVDIDEVMDNSIEIAHEVTGED